MEKSVAAGFGRRTGGAYGSGLGEMNAFSGVKSHFNSKNTYFFIFFTFC